ncbi:hypothetical protein CBL_07960 [Carabus blaptoides fortunei]
MWYDRWIRSVPRGILAKCDNYIDQSTINVARWKSDLTICNYCRLYRQGVVCSFQSTEDRPRIDIPVEMEPEQILIKISQTHLGQLYTHTVYQKLPGGTYCIFITNTGLPTLGHIYKPYDYFAPSPASLPILTAVSHNYTLMLCLLCVPYVTVLA